MYTSYFGLNTSPFSIAPDPLYLYLSEHHREALAHLQYGIRRGGGFVLLTGEVGAGKTTLCRTLLEQLPQEVDVALIFNPKVSVIELLETICDELGIDRPRQGSIKKLVDRINTYLLKSNALGRKTVLFIDEAQNLSTGVLEQLRLLTNLETTSYKLLQIVLLGQPELLEILDCREMRQLSQRITARYHLGPLAVEEVDAYIRHRLEIAGCNRPLFPKTLSKTIWQLTGGIPRLINLVCDRALLGAYARERTQVDSWTLRQGAREVLGREQPQGVRSWRRPLATGLAGFILLLLVAGAWSLRNRPSAEVTLPAAPPPKSMVQPQRQAKAIKPAKVMAAKQDVPQESLPQKWPQDFATNQGMAGAFADLAGLWGLSYRADRSDYCSYAIENGLDCLIRKDSLDTLREINRPAILTLYGDDGAPFQVVMTRLESDSAIFMANGTQKELALSAIASRWFGEYLLLWRRPPLKRLELKPGETGASVEWLANALQELGLYAATGRETRLEGLLLGAFKHFQFSHGLTPDGVLGPMSLIHLNTARNLVGPRLFSQGAR